MGTANGIIATKGIRGELGEYLTYRRRTLLAEIETSTCSARLGHLHREQAIGNRRQLSARRDGQPMESSRFYGLLSALRGRSAL
uniref:Uncharacterized protein n=1 Tax=Tanacetum cinerariifolium TaxID=118510 RepID=A0A699T7U2_TANCI|nr:hypothetical protein [Tanacetum cinerariifolium]